MVACKAILHCNVLPSSDCHRVTRVGGGFSRYKIGMACGTVRKQESV